MDDEVVKKLRERYNHIHPLIFHRSMEHARSEGELFDILYDIPSEFPLIWDDEKHRWSVIQDQTCAKELQ